jgi:DNA polymerase
LGKAVSISRSRGTVTEIGTLPVIVTYHPSSILRQRERPDRERRMETLVADLRRAASILVANHGRGVATNG